MVPCKLCGKLNSLDSTFCRSCGERLPEDEVQAAQEANAKLVAEGQRLLAEGRPDEAAMTAEEAIARNPSDVTALALLGDCREREGRIEEALECYEQIVDLNPESPLDRIRVAHLRKALTAQAVEVTNPRGRRNALLAALLTTVLIIAVGATIILLTDKEQPATKQDPSLQASNQQQPIQPYQPVTQTPPTENGTGNAADQGAPKSGTPSAPDLGQYRTDGTRPAAISGSLPGVGESGVFPIEGNRNNTIVPDGPATKTGSPTPDPTAPKIDPDPEVKAPVDPPYKRPSIVRITPSKGGNTNIGGSTTIGPSGNSPQEADTLVRVARQNFLAGDYTRAADAYAKALRAGADKGSTNQRLAQCYEKLGRRDDAVQAYQRAITGFEGRTGTDRQRAATAIDSCKQAIKLLQGG
jgi:tetratricopeptide (TPR) repeat protein